MDHTNFGQNSQTYWEAFQTIETSGRRGGRIAVADQEVQQAKLLGELHRRQIVKNIRELYWKAEASEERAVLYEQDAAYFPTDH